MDQAQSVPSDGFQTDLRAATSIKLRRGLLANLVRILILIVLDIVAITAAWRLSTLSCNYSFCFYEETSLSLFLVISTFISIGTAAKIYKAGVHRRDYASLVQTVSLSCLLLAITSHQLTPNLVPTIAIFWLLSILLTCVSRYGFHRLVDILREQGGIRYSVFLITDAVKQEETIQLLNRQNYYTLAGVAEPDALDRANREATFKMLQERGITEVFVSESVIKDRLYICWRFQAMGITLRVLSDDLETSLPRFDIWVLENIPARSLQASIIIGSDYWLKRLFDFIASVILLILLSPVYLVLGLLIKLDSPGPIFFRQTRVGLYGQTFKVWKFRTMVQNADKLQAVLEAKNEMKDGVLFKMKDDPRITKVGKFLRQYSLDELPQLFNVLIGNMSFVGPRPLPVRDVQKFKEKHFIRQEVLPGITGLWQVSGRSDIDNFDDAVKLDLQYIATWSLMLDFKILLKTVQVVLQKSGAY